MNNFYNAYIEHFKTQPTSILEIGSRDGDCAKELQNYSRTESHNVFIVEPHPISYRNIINKYPEYKVFELAITNKPNVLDFNAVPYNNDLSVIGTSSLLKKNKSLYKEMTGLSDETFENINPENWIKVLGVNGITLLQLINRHEIDMVKIDVEGFTYQVLDSFGSDLRLLKMLHLEVEGVQVWENQYTTEAVVDILTWYGFKQVYYTPLWFNGKQGDSIWVRS